MLLRSISSFKGILGFNYKLLFRPASQGLWVDLKLYKITIIVRPACTVKSHHPMFLHVHIDIVSWYFSYYLSQVPPQLLRLGTSLRTLDLSNNKLKVLPAALGGFTSLKSLTLTSNNIGNSSSSKALNIINNLIIG